MKKIFYILFAITIIIVPLKSQTIDGNLQVVENNGTTFGIKLQINVEQGSAILGNADIRYNFNTAGLSFPQNPVLNKDYIIHTFNDGEYATAVSHPLNGTISINISKTSGTGITLTTKRVDVATIYFTIIDTAANSKIQPDLRQFFSPSSSTLWSLGTWNSGNSLLPVELVSFTAQTEGNNVLLKWVTATETNNYGFNIERKIESTKNNNISSDWEVIGFINGNGTSTEPSNYTYKNQKLSSGKYLYRLKQIDTNGSFTYSKSIEVELTTSEKFKLKQNYPNPFNPTTTISYSIPTESKVVLKIYNLLGEEVSTLVNNVQSAGVHNIQFNANKLASGTYIYRITAGKFTLTKKMILLK